QPTNFKFTYSLEDDIKTKIEAICKNIYGAKDVSYTEQAEKDIKTIKANGWDKLPICMAKTQYSLSHDPELKGVPTGFTVPIRGLRAFVGAGMVVAYLGEISTMPGLPTK